DHHANRDRADPCFVMNVASPRSEADSGPHRYIPALETSAGSEIAWTSRSRRSTYTCPSSSTSASSAGSYRKVSPRPACRTCGPAATTLRQTRRRRMLAGAGMTMPAEDLRSPGSGPGSSRIRSWSIRIGRAESATLVPTGQTDDEGGDSEDRAGAEGEGLGLGRAVVFDDSGLRLVDRTRDKHLRVDAADEFVDAVRDALLTQTDRLRELCGCRLVDGHI